MSNETNREVTMMNNNKIRNVALAALVSIHMVGAADSVPALQPIDINTVACVGFTAGMISFGVGCMSGALENRIASTYYSAHSWLNSANSYLGSLGTIQPVRFSMRNPRGGRQSYSVENILYFITQSYAAFKQANPRIVSEEEYCRTMLTGAAALLKGEQREQFLATAQQFNSKLFTIDPATVDASNIDLHAYMQEQSGNFVRWFRTIQAVNEMVTKLAGIGACLGIFHGAAGLYIELMKGILMNFGYQAS